MRKYLLAFLATACLSLATGCSSFNATYDPSAAYPYQIVVDADKAEDMLGTDHNGLPKGYVAGEAGYTQDDSGNDFYVVRFNVIGQDRAPGSSPDVD